MSIDIPIIDTHVHIWDPSSISYSWLADVPKINKPHLPADYRQATAGQDVEKLIFVQCEADFHQYRQEVQWVTQQLADEPRFKAMVPWAPLEKGDGASEELAQLARNPLVRGVRRIIQFEPDVEFCLQPQFVRGVQLLAEFDLHFEICIKGDEQFLNTLKLVDRCPHVQFILNHIGKPFIKEKTVEPWATYIQELASMPHTWCKMSGLINEADWQTWTPDDLRPYIDRVLESFGPGRVMFGGDWPVCTLAGTYRRWIDTLWDALGDRPPQDRHQIFYANAAKFYHV